jgi:hypothetical protein
MASRQANQEERETVMDVSDRLIASASDAYHRATSFLDIEKTRHNNNKSDGRRNRGDVDNGSLCRQSSVGDVNTEPAASITCDSIGSYVVSTTIEEEMDGGNGC